MKTQNGNHFGSYVKFGNHRGWLIGTESRSSLRLHSEQCHLIKFLKESFKAKFFAKLCLKMKLIRKRCGKKINVVFINDNSFVLQKPIPIHLFFYIPSHKPWYKLFSSVPIHILENYILIWKYLFPCSRVFAHCKSCVVRIVMQTVSIDKRTV
jgi:hypothetical protein